MLHVGLMRFLALFAVASLAVACAPSTTAVGTTTVTSAEMEAPQPGSARSELGTETPAGHLVCRASSLSDGRVEIYLDWKDSGASGTLRRRAPSGEITEQKLHAERIKGAIVADDVLSHDLVVHAAMVREHKGRTYVRLGDWKQGWTPCE